MNPPLHFRVSGELSVWPRTLCRLPNGVLNWRFQRARKNTRELRENAVVWCFACMVLKDKWLEARRKPMTIRRRNELHRRIGYRWTPGQLDQLPRTLDEARERIGR